MHVAGPAGSHLVYAYRALFWCPDASLYLAGSASLLCKHLVKQLAEANMALLCNRLPLTQAYILSSTYPGACPAQEVIAQHFEQKAFSSQCSASPFR